MKLIFIQANNKHRFTILPPQVGRDEMKTWQNGRDCGWRMCLRVCVRACVRAKENSSL